MRRIIYALCLFFGFSLYTSGFTLDDVVKALERNSSHLKDMSCEVVVETDLGNEVKVQRMKLWSKGEKLRMEMDGGMCMVMDGERVMMETSQGRSVMPMGFGGRVVKTRIEYRNVKINQGLKDELFYIPEGGNEERK